MLVLYVGDTYLSPMMLGYYIKQMRYRLKLLNERPR